MWATSLAIISLFVIIAKSQFNDEKLNEFFFIFEMVPPSQQYYTCCIHYFNTASSREYSQIHGILFVFFRCDLLTRYSATIQLTTTVGSLFALEDWSPWSTFLACQTCRLTLCLLRLVSLSLVYASLSWWVKLRTTNTYSVQMNQMNLYVYLSNK